MKTMMFAIALAAASTLGIGAAVAEGPRASGGGYPSAAVTQAAPAPHYEWQYSYVGHHPRYEGHWVLVR